MKRAIRLEHDFNKCELAVALPPPILTIDNVVTTPWPTKTARFVWRTMRNLASCFPPIRNRLFPTDGLAVRFGPADLAYGIAVFGSHWRALREAGFEHATDVLEIGPGRNLTTALLIWSELETRKPASEPSVTMWDVFRNMNVDPSTLQVTASDLIGDDFKGILRSTGFSGYDVLKDISTGKCDPRITYNVTTMRKLMGNTSTSKRYDLVYSQASIEHIWHIEYFWEMITRNTRPGGWHSHRIDLADHGRRETNYIEMLEWSDFAYWITMRFIPGATNRFRASSHLLAMRKGGLEILAARRTTRPALPVPRDSLARKFQYTSDEDLRSVAIDVVARKVATLPEANAPCIDRKCVS